MDVLTSLLVMSVTQTGLLFADFREVIGMAAAIVAAMAAAKLGWYTTDRALARRSRSTDED